MKLPRLLLILLLASAPLLQSGCPSVPSERVIQVRTLGILGSTMKTGMDGATQLLKQGRITVDQWRNAANFYDNRWQPAFNLAVATVKADLSSVASPDLQKIADEFAALLGTFATPTSGTLSTPKQYLAADGRNIITDYGEGRRTTTLVHVLEK